MSDFYDNFEIIITLMFSDYLIIKIFYYYAYLIWCTCSKGCNQSTFGYDLENEEVLKGGFPVSKILNFLWK